MVLPDDIDVPISSTTGMSSDPGAAGVTKSIMFTLASCRTIWPKYSRRIRSGSIGEIEVARPNKPALVRASSWRSPRVARQSPTPSRVAERLPSAPTSRSPRTSSAMRPVFVSHSYRRLRSPTTRPTTKSPVAQSDLPSSRVSKGAVHKSEQRVTEVKK